VDEIVVHPVAYVRGGRRDPDDDGWARECAVLELTDRFGPDAVLGLEAFSHLEVVYHFHRVAEVDEVPGSRHPRDRMDWPRVGIFAQRGRVRPNRLGVSVCSLLGVAGTTLHVRGLDAIDGTPVLDIKPFMPEFGPHGPVVTPAWSQELMAGYW
jgi:tRNA-Thr(GGU) m(6)t(6)A37 methyltransferase TsaA